MGKTSLKKFKRREALIASGQKTNNQHSTHKRELSKPSTNKPVAKQENAQSLAKIEIEITNATNEKRKALLETQMMRHGQLQTSLDAFLANSMGEWCNEYLRQLATTAAQVRTLSDLATRQAELLKKSSNT